MPHVLRGLALFERGALGVNREERPSLFRYSLIQYDAVALEDGFDGPRIGDAELRLGCF